MSHIVPLLIIAFIVWRWLGKGQRQKNIVRQEGDRPGSPWTALDEGGSDEDVSDEDVADAGDVVAALFGEKGQELLGRVVGRALQESKLGAEISREIAELVTQAEPVEPAIPAARPQARARQRQRVKYLLDGEAGYRQKTDRIAGLQQAMRGKGLCSPR